MYGLVFSVMEWTIFLPGNLIFEMCLKLLEDVNNPVLSLLKMINNMLYVLVGIKTNIFHGIGLGEEAPLNGLSRRTVGEEVAPNCAMALLSVDLTKH